MAALRARTDVAAGLVAAMRGWSDDLRGYKDSAVDEQLLSWLDDIAVD